jgi:hypothetical protein
VRHAPLSLPTVAPTNSGEAKPPNPDQWPNARNAGMVPGKELSGTKLLFGFFSKEKRACVGMPTQARS